MNEAMKRYLATPKGKATKARADAAYYSRFKARPDAYLITRDKSLRKRFQISLDEYNALFMEQRGLCACCGQPETIINKYTGKLQPLSVDHDHVTKQNRGLVCARCNRFVIPVAELYPQIFPLALAYLRK